MAARFKLACIAMAIGSAACARSELWVDELACGDPPPASDDPGTEAWVHRDSVSLAKASGTYSGPSTVTDADCNVYVTASPVASDGVVHQTYALRKRGPDGGVLWTHEAADVYPTVVVSDDAGDVVVGGRASDERGWLRKLDAGGHELWTRHIDSAERSGVVDLSSDRGGSLIACALELRAGSAVTLVSRYTPDGDRLWTHEAGESSECSVAWRPDGGSVLAAGLAANSTVTALTSDGRSEWSTELEGVRARDVLADPLGRIIVGATDDDQALWLFQLTPAGERGWTTRYDEDDSIHVRLATDAEGAIFVAAGGVDGLLLKLRADGSLRWSFSYRLQAMRDVAVDPGGYLIASGSQLNDTVFSFHTRKLVP